jgi:hypothetical protein
VGPTGRPAGETGGKLLELLALDMHGYPDDGLLHTLPDRLHTVSGAVIYVPSMSENYMCRFVL